jgi:hypothetical protein
MHGWRLPDKASLVSSAASTHNTTSAGSKAMPTKQHQENDAGKEQAFNHIKLAYLKMLNTRAREKKNK